ncbi:MAG TPA: BrnT family toxin [Sphingomonadaceae bacterium]
MEIEYDAANVAKHGISLGRTVDFEQAAVVAGARFAEPRLRIYGLIDGCWYCAAVTLRGDIVRIISLRRAHWKEVKRHV